MLYPLVDAARQSDGFWADGVVMLLYSIALGLGLVLSSPWWIARMLTTERYREGMRERLGRVPGRLREAVAGFSSAGSKHARVVWVHAVSVGEVLAASRLIGELEAGLSAASGEAWRVVVSTTTRTGQTLARERFGAERVFYFPLDFAWAVRAYLRVLRPAALVLMESEIWPRLLWECGRAGVPVCVVNARVSDRSFARGMKVSGVWGRVLRGISLWLAQSEEDAKRLVEMGAGAENVRAVGNLKYDVRAPKESRVAELIKEAAAGRPIVVAGSTVGGTSLNNANEEEIVLNAWHELPMRNSSGVLLVLAPRHPERFPFVTSIVDTFYARASELHTVRGSDGFQIEYDVIVLDTIGDLAAVYGVADIAFVGGSLMKRGGHNPLEPAQFGVPVVMGPSFENFRDIVAKMQAEDAIRIVGGGEKQIPFGDDSQKSKNAGAVESSGGKSATAGLSAAALRASGRDDKTELVEELEHTFVNLLTDPDDAKAMGERGRRVFEEQQGATGRAVEAIVALVRREEAA